jgi:hypothetical protein
LAEIRCYRTFCLVIARGLAARAVRDPTAYDGHGAPPPPLASAVREVRAHPPENELAALESELDDEERKLIVLRISEQMSWLEIADALSADGPLAGPARRARAAALRARFTRAKGKLRAAAEDAGMLPCLDDAP